VFYRRAASIAAALILIPQLLGAREVACPRHGESQLPVAAETESMKGHEHHHETSGQSTAPGEHHAPSDCCPAMNTCSNGAAIQVFDNALTGRWWHDDVPADVVTYSPSRVESPDPPPPKA